MKYALLSICSVTTYVEQCLTQKMFTQILNCQQKSFSFTLGLLFTWKMGGKNVVMNEAFIQSE